MCENNIKNLEDLIRSYTGPSKKILKTEVAKLTAPGENYIGLVLRVDAALKDESTGKEEEFHAVAKCCKTDWDDTKQVITVMYLKECTFYTEIVPTLLKFLQEEGIEENFDIFAELYSSRRNAHGNSEEVDEDSVLLFENLKVKGYVNIDKCTGFDLDGAKTLLKDLALFHTVPLAFKLKNPDGFKKLKKYLSSPNFDVVLKGESFWVQIMNECDETKPYVKQFAKIMKYGPELELNSSPVEPFATIAHNDVWTNNTMQILKDGKTIKNKFIDLQLYAYGSPAIDVLLFLWTSVELSVLVEHFDSLLDFYYNRFIEYLKKFGIETSAFAYDKFDKELQRTAPTIIDGILFRVPLIFTRKGEAAPEFLESRTLKKELLADNALQRAIHLVSIFGKKGWLQLEEEK